MKGKSYIGSNPHLDREPQYANDKNNLLGGCAGWFLVFAIIAIAFVIIVSLIKNNIL